MFRRNNQISFKLLAMYCATNKDLLLLYERVKKSSFKT